jgi:hypothetical protein
MKARNKESAMILTRGKTVRFLLGVAALVVILTSAASEALAHRRPWRHIHRRPVLVVSRPAKVKHVVRIDGRPHGTIDFSVDPSETEVYVDDKLQGTVDDFDGRPQKLHLLPGLHKITLRTPKGAKVSRTLDIRAATEIDVKLP